MMKFYAFVEFKTGETNQWGDELTETGYVTESILKKNKNQQVKVYCCGLISKYTKVVKLKNIVTVIPQY